MTKQIEWIKSIIQLCLSNTNEDELREKMVLLKVCYEQFSADEKISVRTILREQLERKDYIYIVSFIIEYTQLEEFVQEAMSAITTTEYAWQNGCMLEYHVMTRTQNQYGLKRLLHSQNIERLSKAINIEYMYSPIEKRNKKRIVIFTEQLLSVRHAPTKVVLNFAYILQKKMGYEVLLVICPCNDFSIDEQWYKEKASYIDDDYEEGVIVEHVYRDEKIKKCIVSMHKNSIGLYRSILNYIQDWNPYFVFSMGLTNPIGELVKSFTTLVSMGMTIECPVSEADIIVRFTREQEEKEAEYLLRMETGQQQVFMESNIPVIVEQQQGNLTRSELKLPEDKFLIAVVGNRLDKEIDEEFINVLKGILDKESNVGIAFIGEAEQIKKVFANDIYKDRIFFLGYCENLQGTYHAVNLYLNPKRLGGGFSSAMALSAGVPVITLSDCDVAYNVGNDFIISNYDEMITQVHSYVIDDEFYMNMKEKALLKGNTNTEEKLEKYVRNMIDKISQAMEKRNDSI